MNLTLYLKPLVYALSIVTLSIFIYLLSMFGIFKGYDFFFGTVHVHKWHSLFRMCFVLIFALVNHIILVPLFYIRKRYLIFLAIVLFCLMISLVLPDLFMTPPKLGRLYPEQPKFSDKPFHISPMRTLVCDLIHTYLFLFISVFLSIGIKTRQYELKIEQEIEYEQKNKAQIDQNNEQEPIDENSKENVLEKQIATALTVTVDYSLVRIEFSEILFIKSMGNYLHFFLKDKKPILVRMTLKDAMDKLPSDDFRRVHKSYIVSVSAIESIRNKMILINAQEIPLGRAYEEDVLKFFGK
jgi:hypothetical protein